MAAVAVSGLAKARRWPVPQCKSSIREEHRAIGFKGRCFRCGSSRMAREGKEPRPTLRSNSFGKEGRIVSRCGQGNGHGVAVAPEVIPLNS